MERVLSERSDDLALALVEVGFSRAEAERFVGRAGPALIRSYEWQAEVMGPSVLDRPGAARELLAGIHGRRLASEVGLPEDKTWAGLREFVPAVLRAQGSRRPRDPGGRGGGRPRRSSQDRALRFDVGFGLGFDGARRGDRGANGGSPSPPPGWADHPIIGRLLSEPE